MGVLSIDQLKELRSEVVGVIADNPDAIISDPSLDYTTVLELVRTTGRTDLFRIALDKVRQLEDKALQSTAWIEVLDAIETEISLQTAVAEDEARENSELEGQPAQGDAQPPQSHEDHSSQHGEHHQ